MPKLLIGAMVALAVIACTGEPPRPSPTPTPVPLSSAQQEALIETALVFAAEVRHWSDQEDEARAKSDAAWATAEDKMLPSLNRALATADQIEARGHLLRAEEFRQDAIFRYNSSVLVTRAQRADMEWELVYDKLADAQAAFAILMRQVDAAGLRARYVERLDAELDEPTPDITATPLN